MRLKEGSSDYRYFPDPDLGPIEISKEQKDKWLNELPELPSKKRQKYVKELGLSPYDSCLLYTSPSPRDGLLSRMPSSA